MLSYRPPEFRLCGRQVLEYALFTSNQEIQPGVWGNLAEWRASILPGWVVLHTSLSLP